jgi:uncharacterized protein YjbJ (UPF0337 family)
LQEDSPLAIKRDFDCRPNKTLRLYGSALTGSKQAPSLALSPEFYQRHALSTQLSVLDSGGAIGEFAYRLHMKETVMNWDIVAGNWKQFKGKVQGQWGKLTDDQIDVIAGRRDELLGRVQEVYGIGKDEAEKQIKHFEAQNKGEP